MAADADRGRHRRNEAGELVHPALLYADNDAYIAETVPFLREGAEAGEPVMMAAPPAKLDLVRQALGPVASEVTFHDMTLSGRNPGRIIGGVLRAFADEHPDTRVRIIGEPIWAGRSPAEYTAAVQHEALINVALADRPATILCPYDVTALDATTIADAARTHPVLVEGGTSFRSDQYNDPVELAQCFSSRLAESAELGETLVFDAPGGPRAVRLAVAEHALRAGLDEDRVADLCLAAYEVAVNTVLHTGRPGLLAVWTRGRGSPAAEPPAVVCEIQDRGWIADPLVGRHGCGPAEGGGYGLHLVNELCDLVQVHSDPSLGTTVRMTMRLADPSPSPSHHGPGRRPSRHPR
ncbi:sensor histidine kinase [Actinomycetospora endophytica]|uniref:Sensor histidine kinase n=1 Tax=Actinomycetospora endophytica TaxID=2291215 RepID=A0ABS8P1D0_9PSEU|nr:sensor histidine kinase [Actinomycetospora endophytica]MCD2191899.1 sensor histidine kinase [Actinomycetospora endophytica]